MIRTIFLAPPGAGKGTQAKKLAEATGAMHLSTGEALRLAVKEETPVGLRAKVHMDAGELAPDEIVLEIVKDSLQKSSEIGWILDGFPRNEKQAIALDVILTELNQEKYCVIHFEVPDNILIERVAKRYEEEGRDDDKYSAVVQARLQTYRKETAPLIDFYDKQEVLKVIDGSRSIDIISNELLEDLKRQDLILN